MSSNLYISELCTFLYGEDKGHWLARQIHSRLSQNANTANEAGSLWDQRDVYLITYADQFSSTDHSPLETLEVVCKKIGLDSIFSGIHLLPFFPSTSDGGFAVSDYDEVDPRFGSWSDIKTLQQTPFDLAFDFVVNHTSSEHAWFKRYLTHDPDYEHHYIAMDPSENLSAVTRPRSLPLLTQFNDRWLWTTFSPDQLDLNFQHPQVTLQMLDVMIRYIQRGAKILRMDAIGFLWKMVGTNCMHQPETHALVKMFRAVAEQVNPNTLILTETNVPQDENFSYFGEGDEAHLVYQFSLPPLLMHGFMTGDSRPLSEWVNTLPELSANQTFFNFFASHDGIGVRPLEGLVEPDVVTFLANKIEQAGGYIGYRTNSDGTESPYELNISLASAFSQVSKSEELQRKALLCSQAIVMALKGIPALYIHSILATENDRLAVERSQHKRDINRHKFSPTETRRILDTNVDDLGIIQRLKHLAAARRSHPAFHPNASQTAYSTASRSVFGLLRAAEHDHRILCLFNLSAETITEKLSDRWTGGGREILSGETYTTDITLSPFDFKWIHLP